MVHVLFRFSPAEADMASQNPARIRACSWFIGLSFHKFHGSFHVRHECFLRYQGNPVFVTQNNHPPASRQPEQISRTLGNHNLASVTHRNGSPDILSLWCRRNHSDAFKAYVRFIETQTGCPVSIISVGPDRDAVILR